MKRYIYILFFAAFYVASIALTSQHVKKTEARKHAMEAFHNNHYLLTNRDIDGRLREYIKARMYYLSSQYPDEHLKATVNIGLKYDFGPVDEELLDLPWYYLPGNEKRDELIDRIATITEP